ILDRAGPQAAAMFEGLKGRRAIIDFGSTGEGYRFRLPDGNWEMLPIGSLTNMASRAKQGYIALDPTLADVPIFCTPCEPDVRGPLTVFVNPYASTGSKSMPPQLFDAVLRQLSTLPAAYMIMTPASPYLYQFSDQESILHLREVGRSHSRNIELPTCDVRGYIGTVRRAAIVISSDTSTPHIAARLAI